MTLFTDAGATHNGFPDNHSFICVHDGSEVLIDRAVGNVTINVAEILAIQEAIVLARQLPTEIYSDSLLAVNLLTGVWKARKPHLKALVETIALPENVSLCWIPREENLAGQYLEAQRGI